MPWAALPAYWLGGPIVSPRPAPFAAAAGAAIPAFLHAPMLLPEPLAYPYAALCCFLIVKALATRSAWWISGAAVASAAAPAVKGQLAVVPAVYVLAALGLAWNGRWMRRWQERWTAWDWIGAVTLLLGGPVVVDSVITHPAV